MKLWNHKGMDMSEAVEDLRWLATLQKALRKKFGVECPKCKSLRPRTNPSILLPRQVCKVDGYRDPRTRLTDAHYQEVAKAL